jgi:hypothetical protein
MISTVHSNRKTLESGNWKFYPPLTWFCLFLLFLPAVLGAQESGISIGIGSDATLRNINTEPNRIIIDTPGFGGLLQVDYRFNSLFAIGARGGVSYAPFAEDDRLVIFRGDAFFRWYLFRLPYTHFFLQTGVGLMSAHRGWDSENARGTIEAGGAIGVRFFLPYNWYMEISARSGYPFVVGAGLALGWRFPSKEEKPIPESFTLLFGPNATSLFSSTLDSTTRLQNDITLNQVVKLLAENPHFRLRVEGYANPVLKTKAESTNALVPISLNRAQDVADRLVYQGIARDRLVVLANDGQRQTTANTNYPKRGAQNHRVELHVIR